MGFKSLASFFSKSEEPKSLTFKSRVELFWLWYASAAERFYKAIEAGECSALATEVNEKIDELLDGFAWVFGPGENGQGHSFTLTGEANRHRQLLAAYWKDKAPVIDGWTFYASRQPSPDVSRFQLDLENGLKFNPAELWITVAVNEEDEAFDIHAWNPKFADMQERHRFLVLFLLLDEALGELGTQRWIREIKISDAKLAHAMPLKELSSFVSEVSEKHGWKLLAPGESATLYRHKSQHTRFPRGDILVGVTLQSDLIHDYLEADGQMEDPLSGTGADYVYVTFPADFLPKGKEADARGKLEDALDEALTNASSGQILGGATGTRFAYLDAIIYDGKNSELIIRDTLRKLNLPKESVIRCFAKEKQDRTLSLR